MTSCPAGDAGPSDHLSPNARAWLALSDEERIRRIEGDRWIGYARAKSALERMERILTSERRQRPENLLILGPSNNGKSMIARRFMSLLARTEKPLPLDREGAQAAPIRAILVQAPRGPDLKSLFLAILEATGTPHNPRAARIDLEASAYAVLRQIQLRMLVIDDLHNCLDGSRAMLGRFLTQLRLFGNELGVSLVCLGTKEALYVLQSREQLRNRFEPCPLPRWRLEDPDYVRLLNSFVYVLPLREASPLSSPRLAERILVRAEGLIGEVATILRRAAVLAVTTGAERITFDLLDQVEYVSPSLRQDAETLDIV